MAYPNEPQESCLYLDRALAEIKSVYSDIEDILRDAIRKAEKEIDEVRDINETLRTQNRELHLKVEELADQVRDLENRIEYND